MKGIAIILVTASMAFGQSQTKPAAPAAKSAGAAATTSSGKTTSTAAKSAAAKQKTDMPVITGAIKPLFVERYVDIKVGAGPLAEPYKLYTVHYTGYLAATGQKFDSSYDHRMPVKGSDGKPVTDADGKPQLGEAQPMVFPQGAGRLIPGFDQGLAGMHIGGKRRIFIPWQLAYGTRDIPSREGRVGIPPKSDLIFDVELVNIADMPAAPAPTAAQRPAAAPSGQPAAAAPAAPQPAAQPAAAPAASAPAASQPASSAPTSTAPASSAPASSTPAAPPEPK